MASKESKLHIVRCPKCRRLLMEFADVPVYKCGVCGTVLQAKKRQMNNNCNASHMVGNISSVETLSQHVSDAGGSDHDKSTSLNQQPALSSTDSNSADIDHVGENKHVVILSEKTSCSDSEIRYPKEEESSECTENSNVEAGLTDDNLDSTRQPEMLGNETISGASDHPATTVQVTMDSFSEEELDDSWKVSEHGSVASSSGCKINVTENNLGSEEDIVDEDSKHISCEKMNAPVAGSAHACDANDSSYNGISNSSEQYQLSAVGGKEVSNFNNTRENNGKADHTISEISEDPKADAQSRNLHSKSSGERCASINIFGNSASNPRLSLNLAYRRENSRQSEIFHSARKELEDDSLSMPLSRDSSFQDLLQHNQNGSPSRLKNLENDRMELLRKVDELRDHLTRPYSQGQERNKRFHIRGTRQDGKSPPFFSRGSSQVLQCRNSNITQTHSRGFGQIATAQPYQSVRVPFPGQGNSSCLHHCPKDCCIPVQLPPHIFCNACSHHALYHSSTVSSPWSCNNCNIAVCSHKSQIGDQHFEKLHYKEKRQPLKRHCRPVLGGAPFVICNKCLQLLQVPVDFLVSGARYHKLKCGGCSELLVFLSHGGGHVVPHSGNHLDPAPSEADNVMEHTRGHELSTDHSSGDCLQGDPVSYSEECGPPVSHSYSTDGEPAQNILFTLRQERRRRGKQALGSPLHRLMGYDSATELIYQPSDEDEAYISRDMTCVYRTSNQVHVNEVDTGTGMDYPLQGQSEIECCSPEHTEMPKGRGSVMRLPDRKGGSPVRGLFNKGVKELNHGLESMKLKKHTGRRS